MKKSINKFTFIMFLNFMFISFVNAEEYTNYTPSTTSCGNKYVEGIPSALPDIIRIIYNIIQIAVPVVLVIMGMLDLMKGVTAQKDDEMKKGQHMLVKRLIAAALVFFVFAIVKLVVSFAASDDIDASKPQKIMACAECFIKGECDKKN